MPSIDALRDLVSFAQFKKREKFPWMSVTFSKVAGFSLQQYHSSMCIFHFFKFVQMAKIGKAADR